MTYRTPHHGPRSPKILLFLPLLLIGFVLMLKLVLFVWPVFLVLLALGVIKHRAYGHHGPHGFRKHGPRGHRRCGPGAGHKTGPWMQVPIDAAPSARPKKRPDDGAAVQTVDGEWLDVVDAPEREPIDPDTLV